MVIESTYQEERAGRVTPIFEFNLQCNTFTANGGSLPENAAKGDHAYARKVEVPKVIHAINDISSENPSDELWKLYLTDGVDEREARLRFLVSYVTITATRNKIKASQLITFVRENIEEGDDITLQIIQELEYRIIEEEKAAESWQK